jgi:hypothetical protein
MMYLIIITTNTYKVLSVAVATIVSLLLRVLLRVLVRVCKLGHTKPFRSSVMATSAVPTAVLSSVESNTQGHDLLMFSNDGATLHLATCDSMSRFNLCPSMVNRKCPWEVVRRLPRLCSSMQLLLHPSYTPTCHRRVCSTVLVSLLSSLRPILEIENQRIESTQLGKEARSTDHSLRHLYCSRMICFMLPFIHWSTTVHRIWSRLAA